MKQNSAKLGIKFIRKLYLKETDRRISIYGGGGLGQSIYNFLLECGICVKEIYDQNAKSIKEKYPSEPIRSADNIDNNEFDLIIIGVLNGSGVIASQLKYNFSIQPEKILLLDEDDCLFFINKTPDKSNPINSAEIQEECNSIILSSRVFDRCKTCVPPRVDEMYIESINSDAKVSDVVSLFINPYNGIKYLRLQDDSKGITTYVSRERFYAFYGYGDVIESKTTCRMYNGYTEQKFGKDRLYSYADSYYPQFGEDGIVEEIFKRIGFKSKQVVEFGGGDGVWLSNSRHFIEEYGCSGLLIEADHARAEKAKANYCDIENVKIEEGYVKLEGTTLEYWIEKVGIEEQIDLLSIDIDSCDYYIWETLNNNRPRVVIIEYNPTCSNDVVFINPSKDGVCKGSSPRALVDLGIRKGYSLAAVTECNLIFVVDEEFDKLGISHESLDEIRPYKILGDNYYILAYDGEIYRAGGCDRFIWGEGSFDTDRFALMKPISSVYVE